MTSDQKQRWVEALRSGQYIQTKGVLLDYIGGRCCLGVLCVVVPGLPDVLPLARNAGDEDANNRTYRAIERLLGGPFEPLADMNDSGTPFPAIADWIEANLKPQDTPSNG